MNKGQLIELHRYEFRKKCIKRYVFCALWMRLLLYPRSLARGVVTGVVISPSNLGKFMSLKVKDASQTVMYTYLLKRNIYYDDNSVEH